MAESPIRSLVGRLARAARVLPSATEWLVVALLALVFAAVAVPLARSAGLIGGPRHLAAGELALLSLRVLLVPALVEESLFRVLANPHPLERCGRGALWRAGAVSLAAYVLAHPLLALLSPAPVPALTQPVFLLLAALLGLCCLIAFRRTGSLWAPVALHWAVVVGWLLLGGSGPWPLAPG